MLRAEERLRFSFLILSNISLGLGLWNTFCVNHLFVVAWAINRLLWNCWTCRFVYKPMRSTSFGLDFVLNLFCYLFTYFSFNLVTLMRGFVLYIFWTVLTRKDLHFLLFWLDCYLLRIIKIGGPHIFFNHFEVRNRYTSVLHFYDNPLRACPHMAAHFNKWKNPLAKAALSERIITVNALVFNLLLFYNSESTTFTNNLHVAAVI